MQAGQMMDMKFVNLQYNMLVRWYAGKNESLTKHPMLQAFSFYNFLGHSNLFIFIFVILYKILQDFMKKKYLEHQALDQQVICPIGPANQRIIL